MCRIVAYLSNKKTPLSSPVLAPDRSLLVQSYAPAEMMSEVVTADGFGCGWYAPEADGEPAVYRSNGPIWSDRSFASIAPKVRFATLLAAVRSATPGLPAEESGVPLRLRPLPLRPQRRHQRVPPYRHAPPARRLESRAYSDLFGTTDTETIFALLLDQLQATKAAAVDADALASATADTV